MLLSVSSEPAAEPVTLDDIKRHLRVLHASEDTELAFFARTARRHVETVTGRALISRGLTLYLSGFPRSGVIELPQPPLGSVQSVTYLDPAADEQALASSSYHVIRESLIGRLELKASAAWPATAVSPKAVSIAYTAGYGATPAAVPEELRNSILMLTEHFYYQRGATVDTGTPQRVPMAVDALLSPFQTFGWI